MNWNESNLNIQLSIFNDNKFKIYIPLNRWDVVCGKDDNWHYFYSQQCAWINQILYFQEINSEIHYKRDSYYTFKGDCFPKFFTINQMDSLIVNISLNNFHSVVNKDSNYRIQFITPFVTYKKLETAIRYLRLKTMSIIMNKLVDTFKLSYFRYKKPSFDEDILWVPENDSCFCSKHIFVDDNEAWEVIEQLMPIDTVRCEKVLVKKK